MATIRKIDLMHRIFGRCNGHACRECSNLISGTIGNKRLKKCTVYGATHSEASDWAGRYIACGMFNREYKGQREIIKYVRPEQKEPKNLPVTPLDGQISIWDERIGIGGEHGSQ